MKHEIDLSKYNYYTDLALESIKNTGIKLFKKNRKKYDDIIITNIYLDESNSKLLGKKQGNYTTIEFNDASDKENIKKIINILTKELKKYIKVSKDELILVVGLGNLESTPDSLGPKVVDNITITNHIYELGLLDSNSNRVCSICPGVSAKTGIETSYIIESLVKKIKPNLILVIDSLASSSIDRLNKTIQITDTGINPGSGIGNKRKELSINTLHIPVIAIGIPTVVSMSNIVYEILNNINGKYNDKRLQELLDSYDLVITQVEIDYIIENLTKILSTSINNIFKD